jgi:hypothetical protein
MLETESVIARKSPRIGVAKLVWLIPLVLLLGRYDRSADHRRYALEGYLASVWMLALLLPVVFFTTKLLMGRRPAIAAASVLLIVCVLPYRWLGFARTRFWSDHVTYTDWLSDPKAPIPSIVWFPDAFHQGEVIPHEWLVFGVLAACGVVAIIWASRLRLLPSWFAKHPAWTVGTIAFLVILIQSWLHLSLRAPYSYHMHYAQRKPELKPVILFDLAGHSRVRIDQVVPSNDDQWWHLYLFPDGRGAVNRDYPGFRACEEVFQGVAPDGSSPVTRRLLTFYLSSQFVYFFNPYYVFIFLNTAFWLAGTLAGYCFARQLTDEHTARIFALFIATGCGFIFFVNQPTSYLSGYAVEMLTIYFFQRMIIEEKTSAGVWLFGLVYCAALLVTDLLPLLAFFPVYTIARGAKMKRTVASLALACAGYAASLVFLAYVARVPDILGNADLVDSPLAALNGVTFEKIYPLCLEFLNRFAMDMIHGFLILPLIPAILGLAMLRDRGKILAIFALFLPAFLTVALLHFSGASYEDWPLAALPRLAYIAYPAMYLLAAIGLVDGSRLIFVNHPRFARAAPYLFLIAVFVFNNLDVFGAPTIYHHFYFGLNDSGLLSYRNP